jgi:hypothetical protein
MQPDQFSLPSADSPPAERSLINDPDAARLSTGLRDAGYDFCTASADIIDNSIAANATDVNIEVLLMEDGRKLVYFGDNGDGMTLDLLWDAMRYGAPKRPSSKSLGKFGLGLKTASSACCIKFEVISRQDPSAAYAKLAWDLDHIDEVNRWEMIKDPVTKDEEDKFKELCGDKGTLIIWSKCDKILGKVYEEPGGILEQRALKTRTEKLKEHIAKVFHKYIDTAETQYPNVIIRINGAEIQHWNPFYPERSEQVLSDKETILQIALEDGTIATATLKAWILPHSKDMTDEENKTKAKISNRSQGFYIYREGRLLFSEGWLGIFRSDDPHFSLLRAEFTFNHELDHAFQVGVMKNRIIFDPALEEELKNRLTGPHNEADRRYRRKETALSSGTSLDHTSSNTSIDKAKLRTKKPSVTTADPVKGEATINNNRGTVKIKTPVQNNVSPNNLYIEEVTDILDGHLWEPALRSTGNNNHITGVRLNKHHPFYPKVYLKAASSGYAVEGIDFLLWALATAEFNNSNEELKPVFADLREEVSINLKKLLESTPMPDAQELSAAEDLPEAEEFATPE